MPTTQTEQNSHERLAKRRRYRRLIAGFIVGGVTCSLLLRGLGYPVVGEAVYWLGILGFLAVGYGTSVQLMDERDVDLERRASHLALTVLAPVLVLGASAARLITQVTDYTVPTMVWGVLYGYVGLFAVFGLAYGWLRYRP